MAEDFDQQGACKATNIVAVSRYTEGFIEGETRGRFVLP